MTNLPAAEPNTFDQLLGDVETQANKTVNEMIDAANKVAKMLTDAANGVVNTLESLIPFHSSTIDKAIDKWNNDIQPTFEKGLNELDKNLRNSVDKLAGDPTSLKRYADNYANAATTIYVHTDGSVQQDLTLLGESWSGPAFDMFSTVATEQDTALQSLRDALVNGGSQTMAAANKIQGLWIQLLSEFAGFDSDILNIFAGLTNASNVLACDVPGVLSAIATIWTRVDDIATDLLNFMNAQDTTDSYSWTVLAQGSDGLPQNQWPAVGPLAAQTIDDPGNWKTK